MVVGLLACGMAVGMVSLTVALLNGYPFWIAAIAYVIVGTVGTLSAAAGLAVHDRRRGPTDRDSHSDAPGTILAAGSERMSVLVVDDDEIMTETLREMLESLDDLDIAVCHSAREAQDEIARRARPFDCLFLDIRMPEVDGIELCAWIRQQAGYRLTPVVMVTGMTDRKNIHKAFAMGANDYVTKPLDMVTLEQRLFAAKTLVREIEAGEIEGEPEVPVSDATQIEGLSTLGTLENYLAQLERGGLFATNLFTFRVAGLSDDVGVDGAKATSHDIMAAVSLGVSNYLSERGHFLSYAGHGVFAGLVNGRSAPDYGTLADAVEAAMGPIGDTNTCRVTPGPTRAMVFTQGRATARDALADIVVRAGGLTDSKTHENDNLRSLFG